jgi:hypothetical protein
MDITVPEGIDELGAFCGLIIKTGPADIQKIPAPNGLCARLFDAADIQLPEVFPFRNTDVATRQKLTTRR